MPTNIVGKPYSIIDIFKSLTPVEKTMIEDHKECFSYKNGDIVYKEGDKIRVIYQVIKGAFKIYKTGIEEKPYIITFIIPGEISGYRSILSNEPSCSTVEAIEDSEMCFIPSEIIFHLVKSNPDFALSIIQLTGKELDRANSLLTDLAQKKLNERTAEILLMLHNTFGVDEKGYTKCEISRKDLANIVGTASESLIRILSDFKSKKLIDIDNKRIRINDHKRLKLISESI